MVSESEIKNFFVRRRDFNENEVIHTFKNLFPGFELNSKMSPVIDEDMVSIDMEYKDRIELHADFYTGKGDIWNFIVYISDETNYIGSQRFVYVDGYEGYRYTKKFVDQQIKSIEKEEKKQND